MLRAALAFVLLACSPALADPDRTARRRLLALAIDELYIANHDVTVPLPGVRIAYQVNRVILVEGGLAHIPMPYGASATLAHLGGRYLLRDTRFAPYVFARVGVFRNVQDEGDDGDYPFGAAGLGIELAAHNGFAAWVDAGPGLASFEQFDVRTTELALFVSVGLGYRF